MQLHMTSSSTPSPRHHPSCPRPVSVSCSHSGDGNTNTHSQRLAAVRRVLWGFDTKSKQAKGRDGFPSVISLAEGGSLRRPHPGVLLNIQESLFSPQEYQPGTYSFDLPWPGLAQELQRFFRDQCGIDWVQPDNICIGAGSSHILDGLFSALLKPGDLVLTAAPFYHAFADFTVKWEASLEVVPTSVENGLKLTGEDLDRWFLRNPEKASRAKLLLLTNPSTIGSVHTRDELLGLAAAVKRRSLPVFVDEVFRDCVFGATEMVSLASLPGMEELVVTAHSGSKTRGCADLRIGWACGPERLIREIIHFTEHSVTLVPILTQRAAAEALKTPQRYLDLDRQECQHRCELVQSLVAQVNHLSRQALGRDAIRIPVVPQAGHSIMLDFSPLCGEGGIVSETIRSDLDLTRFFGALARPGQGGQDRCGVLLAPCHSNGLNGFFLRAAFAELGHEGNAVNTESEVFAAFEALIRAHSSLESIPAERISAAARLVGLSAPASAHDQEHRTRMAFVQGRALLGEAFARIAHGVISLGLPTSSAPHAASGEQPAAS